MPSHSLQAGESRTSPVICFPVLAAALLLLLPLLSACGGGGWTEEQIAQEAPRIHAEAITIDTHDDAPEAHVNNPDWSAADAHVAQPGMRGAGLWDIPRMYEGGLDATFLVVYIGQRDLTPEGYEAAYNLANTLFDWCDRAVASHPDAELALTTSDIRRLAGEGKKALLIGVENGYPIGNDLGRIGEFYDKGMRYMTLSHNGDNQICASTNPRTEREDFGLTDFGREVVREMNQLGVLVDCSHISDQSFFDVVEVSSVPVAATHSGARAICENSRNMTDEMLLALKENGGVIQMVPLGSFVRGPVPNPARDAALDSLQQEYGDPESMTQEEQREFRQLSRQVQRRFPSPPVTIEDYMKHIDHVVGLIGIDYVGFGSDFDGGGGIEGLEDVSKLQNLTEALMRHGYSESDIKKFWGGNFLRVMEAVEEGAEH